jgi:hypothetical protein
MPLRKRPLPIMAPAMIEADVWYRCFWFVSSFTASIARAFCGLFRQDMPVADWIFKSRPWFLRRPQLVRRRPRVHCVCQEAAFSPYRADNIGWKPLPHPGRCFGTKPEREKVPSSNRAGEDPQAICACLLRVDSLFTR